MPEYKYRCESCKDMFDVWQRMKDEKLSKCIKCKGNLVRLIGSNIGVSFKGRGFYANDKKS